MVVRCLFIGAKPYTLKAIDSCYGNLGGYSTPDIVKGMCRAYAWERAGKVRRAAGGSGAQGRARGRGGESHARNGTRERGGEAHARAVAHKDEAPSRGAWAHVRQSPTEIRSARERYR